MCPLSLSARRLAHILLHFVLVQNVCVSMQTSVCKCKLCVCSECIAENRKTIPTQDHRCSAAWLGPSIHQDFVRNGSTHTFLQASPSSHHPDPCAAARPFTLVAFSGVPTSAQRAEASSRHACNAAPAPVIHLQITAMRAWQTGPPCPWGSTCVGKPVHRTTQCPPPPTSLVSVGVATCLGRLDTVVKYLDSNSQAILRRYAPNREHAPH